AGLVALARALPLLFLLAWPGVSLRTPRAQRLAVGASWSLLLLVQVALEQVFLAARVPLGAEWLAYSLAELRTTAVAGIRSDALALAGWWLPPIALWLALTWQARRPAAAARPVAFVLLLAVSLVAWALPLQPAPQRWSDEDAYAVAVDKPGYFLAESGAWWLRGRAAARRPDDVGGASRPGDAPAMPDGGPRYPFLREDRTPDVLGPLFDHAPQPPHLVFIIVEGLGRSFSGPDAALGSFTPFLDELATRGLYWDNFLSNQGRTFGVLPSLFGSLPFGDTGFAELGAAMPAHAGLLSVLTQQGYRARFYSGWNADFDHERDYLQRQGVQDIVDLARFGPGYVPANEWGYADRDLFARALADLPQRDSGPTLTVLQTITMHTPYTFPGQAAYRKRIEQRLDALGVPAQQRARYRQSAAIYESILYTDDALRAYFEAAAKDASYANTIFVITGDHRLPELPLENRIARYHVPLLIYSPLLKAPRRIRAVSSQFDVAPSLLAYLAHAHGLQRPARATWLGSGLDLAPAFRNLHDIPIKQTKTLLEDFVSGTSFLGHGRLYALDDGLAAEPVDDPAAAARLSTRFDAFRAANAQFARTLALSPEGAHPRLVAYAEAVPASAAPAATAVAVPSVESVDVSRVDGRLRIDVAFANADAVASPAFVPLAVLVDAHGREVGERSGDAMPLAAGARRQVRLEFPLDGLPHGDYFLAVLPSDPGDGKRIGPGRYRIPVSIRR
ncbi:MAG: LTA synthase family protein, partial [Lysobacter sp.]|nr:LTA synthase family protein [Lysobacter sp.]